MGRFATLAFHSNFSRLFARRKLVKDCHPIPTRILPEWTTRDGRKYGAFVSDLDIGMNEERTRG